MRITLWLHKRLPEQMTYQILINELSKLENGLCYLGQSWTSCSDPLFAQRGGFDLSINLSIRIGLFCGLYFKWQN